MKYHRLTTHVWPIKGIHFRSGVHPVVVLWSVVLLCCVSCTTTGVHNKEFSRRAVRAALNGKILYRTSDDQIVLKEFHGRSMSIGSSTVEGAKWSPDGTQFSFVESEGSIPFLSIFDRNGNRINRWQLTGHSLDELAGLTWSPDGQYNALLESGHQIVCIEVESGNSSTFALDPSHTYSALAWCPSNNKIAVAEGRSIWMVKSFRNNPAATLLTSDQEPDPIEAMDWNTKGSMLVFSGGLADSKLKLVDVNGNNCSTLTYSSGSDFIPIQGAAPCWYSDGEQILFVKLHEETIIWNIGLFITDPQKKYVIYLNIPGYDPDCG